MQEDGVKILLGSKVKKIENGKVYLESGESFEAEIILVATGRIPNV
jgi:pyruvate/2-oxoglutarate dehydrogenase complex dihydrolipoamide dehydrogenase (E3) component